MIRESEEVRSRDCARFWRERGFDICSFNLDSNSESDPLLKALSMSLVRLGIPDPLMCVRYKLTA